jgi:DNA-binding GntR family transcriptional regulator
VLELLQILVYLEKEYEIVEHSPEQAAEIAELRELLKCESVQRAINLFEKVLTKK